MFPKRIPMLRYFFSLFLAIGPGPPAANFYRFFLGLFEPLYWEICFSRFFFVGKRVPLLERLYWDIVFLVLQSLEETWRHPVFEWFFASFFSGDIFLLPVSFGQVSQNGWFGS